jgi:hypothetical protein
MPVSGVVLTLDEGAADARLLGALAEERGVSIGERQGSYLPLAVESETIAEGELTCERLRDLPSVLALNVVFIDFSETEPDSAQSSS